MTAMLRNTRIWQANDHTALPFAELLSDGLPTIIRGAANSWPVVQRGQQSVDEVIAYLQGFDTGQPMTAYVGDASIGGRFFYDDALHGLNFTSERLPLTEFLKKVRAGIGDAKAPTLYIGSGAVDAALSGFRADNDLSLDAELIAPFRPLASIWIGNRTVAATHYDMSNNIACCLVGRRRFTLFPPDQIANLYPGPLEPTPGGQVVSMVDARAPDLSRYPRFADALAVAEIAALEPGDILFYPALWWHQVEAQDEFNMMMNYWWNPVLPDLDTPMNSVLHAILSLRDRPTSEKAAWRHIFDYYVFGSPDQAAAHLPPHARGALEKLDGPRARRLRALLLQKFNR